MTVSYAINSSDRTGELLLPVHKVAVNLTCGKVGIMKDMGNIDMFVWDLWERPEIDDLVVASREKMSSCVMECLGRSQ